MSAEKKLYNLQVNPPEQVWEKLSAELDELLAENFFKKKLLRAQSNPPANTWEKIESILDRENAEKAIAEKLMNFSEVPPAGLWNNIETQLAEEEFDKKFASLSELEVTPPAINWGTIVAEINNPTPVVPLQSNRKKFIRYAAAAVIIGLLAWAGINFFPVNNRVETVANAETPKENSTSSTPASTQNENPSIPSTTIAPSPGLQEGIERSVAQNSKQQPKRTKNLAVLSFAPSTTTSESSHTGSEEIVADINALQKNKTPEAAMATASSPDTPRYLVYLNDDGEMMKVSKKLADLKCIYNKNGDVSQDALAAFNRQLCDDMVKSWQDKLSKAPINLSFNPLEMADILK